MEDETEKSNAIRSIGEIDKTIHEPARLMILAYLSMVESADFVFLMNQTDLTWGNLSSHLSTLENAGFVESRKEFVQKKPHTLINITDEGVQAFQEYRGQIQRLLQNTKRKE